MNEPHSDSIGRFLSGSNVIKGIAVLVGLITIFTVARGHSLGGQLQFRLDLDAGDYFGVLTHLAFVSLIVERFVEIFASVIRTPQRVQLQNALRRASDDDRENARDILEAFKAQTGIFTLIISFVTGLIIAAAGVNVLAPLFDTSVLTESQAKFFGAVDVVITAGLIAGGSKGVNTMSAALGAVFDAMKYQSRVTEERAKQDIARSGSRDQDGS